MRFALITPVFDGCLESLKLLYRDIQSQTHRNWIWYLCSNKHSEKISHFVKSIISEKDHRVIYLSIDSGKETNSYNLIASVGRRRDFLLKYSDGDYVLMLDADAKLLDRNMFETIAAELSENPKKLCIYKVLRGTETLPKYPIASSGIDALNFCVNLNLARRVGWPIKVKEYFPANDWWFFVRVYEACKGDYLFIDKIFCEYNGNSCYKGVLTKTKPAFRNQLLDYISYCLNNQDPLGFITAVFQTVLRRIFKKNTSFMPWAKKLRI